MKLAIVGSREFENYDQRNTLIVQNANCVLAFVSASSKGTWDTIRKAESAGKRVIIVKV